jgi:hypothetical protein
MGHNTDKSKGITLSTGWSNLCYVGVLGQKIGIKRLVPWPGFGTPWSHFSTT